MLSIIYHPKYLEYNFGPGHPFIPERGKKFLQLLDEKNIEYKLNQPEKATDDDVLLVHTPEFLSRVKKLAAESGFLSIDTKVTEKILEAAYFYVGGTILAARLALQNEKVVNLLGGLHHAESNTSSGFCIFNDHAIAIRKLQKEERTRRGGGQVKKVMIFDLDIHAGNGTQEIFYEDPSVFNISLHQDPRTLYPGTGFAEQRGAGKGEGFNLNITLPPGTDGKSYLQALDKVLPLHKKFNPDLTFLIFGADTYKEDPLASFNLEISDYKEIGQRFAEFEKLVVLFAGGYSNDVPTIWLELLKGLDWMTP